MDRLREMEIFAATVAGGSLSAAARALGLSVPVVSKEIMRLEARLGSRLLVRTSRHFALTDEGDRFHDAALRVLANLQEAEASVGDGVAAMRGCVRITTPVALGRRVVAPLLARMVRAHPGLHPYLHLSDAVEPLTDGLDVAIRIGAVTELGLVVRKLADNDRVVCGAPGYLAHAGVPDAPEDLARHAMLLFGPDTGRAFVFEHAGGEQRTVRLEPALHTNSGDVLQDVTMAGLGLQIRSFVDVAAEIWAGSLVRVLPDWHLPTGGIFAVFPSRRHVTTRVRRVVDAIAQSLSAP